MIVAMVEGADVILGKAQGYIPLPIRIDPIEVDGGIATTLVSAWTPTPEELEALNRGANVHVRIYADHHPPIMVEVGREPGVDILQPTEPATL